MTTTKDNTIASHEDDDMNQDTEHQETPAPKAKANGANGQAKVVVSAADQALQSIEDHKLGIDQQKEVLRAELVTLRERETRILLAIGETPKVRKARVASTPRVAAPPTSSEPSVTRAPKKAAKSVKTAAPKASKASTKTGGRKPRTSSEDQKTQQDEVLAFLKKNTERSASEIAVGLNMDKGDLTRNLKALKTSKAVKMVGKNKAARYSLR